MFLLYDFIYFYFNFNFYSYFYFLKILFIHERQKERGRDIGKVPCRKPDVGLDPGTPESGLEPKADA